MSTNDTPKPAAAQVEWSDIRADLESLKAQLIKLRAELRQELAR